MTIKITKQLATVEDLAIGTGTIVQERNGVPMTLTKIDLITRSELAGNPAEGLGAALVNGTVIRVTSISAMEAYSAPVGYVFSLNAGGRSGTFDVVSGNFSTALADDTLNGIYIGLADDPTATTKVAKRRNIKEVDISWFGAEGDGQTDSSAAVSAALDFCILTNSTFSAPAGDFLLSSIVEKTPVFSKINMIGKGTGSTRFLVNNTSGGISIQSTSRSTEMFVSGIEFLANLKGAGVGLRITMPSGGNRHNRSIALYDVKASVINENNNTDYGYFVQSFDFSGCWRPLLTNVVVSGPWGPGMSDDLSDTSPIYKSEIGINLNGCYGVEVHESYIWSCQVGISNTSTDNPGPEGFILSNTNIVEVKKALVFSRASQEPTIWISNCHYNYRDRGLEITGSKLININSCVPYNVDTLEEFGGTPEDIFLDNVSMAIISKNIFHFDGNSNRRNIALIGSTSIDNIFIDNNIFNSLASTAVLIGSSATSVFIKDNQYPGNITTKVDDNSNASTIMEQDGSGTYKLESGRANESDGPIYSLFRNSQSPAQNDVIGNLSFDGNNSLANKINYSNIRTSVISPTSSVEKSALQFFTRNSGQIQQIMDLRDAESTNQTAMLLMVNNGSKVIKRVAIGPVDSGGAGFRQLIVSN